MFFDPLSSLPPGRKSVLFRSNLQENLGELPKGGFLRIFPGKLQRRSKERRPIQVLRKTPHPLDLPGKT
jgi:hypothetical protein